MVSNKALVLLKHPEAFPIPGIDLAIIDTEFDPKAPPPEGGLVLKTNYLSFDPYMRGKMRPPTPATYTAGFVHNEPMSNFAVSTVVSSSNPRFKAGDVVLGTSNFQEYVTIQKDRADKPPPTGFEILDNPLDLDPKIFLGALGMSGLTAYSSFYEIGKPKKGETIFISAASGAVGQIVGQLAKREGMKVLGSVGSDAKLKFITEELGFVGGFNYKTENPSDGLKRLLGEIGSKGLDVYYDNVGGEQLDAAIAAMSNFGRISNYLLYYHTRLNYINVMKSLTVTSCLWFGFSDVQESRRDARHRKHAICCWKASQHSRLPRL
jgi:NADPH-dependent curcumin reductase CurA